MCTDIQATCLGNVKSAVALLFLTLPNTWIFHKEISAQETADLLLIDITNAAIETTIIHSFNFSHLPH